MTAINRREWFHRVAAFGGGIAVATRWPSIARAGQAKTPASPRPGYPSRPAGEIIRADAKTGQTVEKHFTPGAGVIYRMTSDIPPRPDTYGRSVRPRATGGQRQNAAAQSAPATSTVHTSDGLGVGRGGDVPANPGPPDDIGGGSHRSVA
jgi:hypothetical protein